jgi:hypothetical protein
LKPCEVRHGKNGEVQFYEQSMVVTHAIKTRFGQVIFFGFPSGNPQLPRQVLKKKTCKKNLILVHLEIFRVDYSYLNID